MIISHEHRFIFIKNRKVGSTSTELALQRICGPDDVLTHDSTVKHMNPRRAARDVLWPEARNYDGPFNPLPELAQVRHPLDGARVLRDWWRRPKFYNHMRASSVRARIPKEVWDSYYKFCFDRNPWDKVISFYYWYGRNKELPELNEFLRDHRKYGTPDQVLPSDWVRYAEGERIIVNDVFDYADLGGGLATALKRAGVPDDIAAKAALGREKTEIRKRESEVRFTPENDALIRRAFRHEISHLDFCRRPDPRLFPDGAVA